VITPTVPVVPGPVVTTGIDVAASSSFFVAATATITPATSATSKRASSAAQSHTGEPLDHTSRRTLAADGSRWPHSRQYSW
jgi:hypothetical protein